MEENQYILKPDGILDRGFAISLIHELDIRRSVRITVDASGIVRALHEGVDELLRAERAGDLAVSEWIHLPEDMAVLLQLNGIPVSRRSAILGMRGILGPTDELSTEDGHGAARDSADVIKHTVLCRRCEAQLSVGAPGLYACPACGVRFYADSLARLVPYEPIHT